MLRRDADERTVGIRELPVTNVIPNQLLHRSGGSSALTARELNSAFVLMPPRQGDPHQLVWFHQVVDLAKDPMRCQRSYALTWSSSREKWVSTKLGVSSEGWFWVGEGWVGKDLWQDPLFGGSSAVRRRVGGDWPRWRTACATENPCPMARIFETASAWFDRDFRRPWSLTNPLAASSSR